MPIKTDYRFDNPLYIFVCNECKTKSPHFRTKAAAGIVENNHQCNVDEKQEARNSLMKYIVFTDDLGKNISVFIDHIRYIEPTNDGCIIHFSENFYVKAEANSLQILNLIQRELSDLTGQDDVL